jgi:predicted RNase H-like nuclease (RuvC/YqgF family)
MTTFVDVRINELKDELKNKDFFRDQLERKIEKLENRKAEWLGLVETNMITGEDSMKYVRDIEEEIRSERVFLEVTIGRIELIEAELTVLCKVAAARDV